MARVFPRGPGLPLPLPDILRNNSCYKKLRILLSAKIFLWYIKLNYFSS